MRVLICGGRLYSDYARVADRVALLPRDAIVVTGGAQGADRMAEEAALSIGLKTETHYANWNKHGRAAGVIRNQEMLDTGIDKVIAFPGGIGTSDMCRRARKAGVPVEVIA